MDEFYDIIAHAQKNDPEFEKLAQKSAGTLVRQLNRISDDLEENDFDNEESPVFQVTLFDSGKLRIQISNQMNAESVLELLDYVKDKLEDSLAENDGDDE